jgi:hypothetical protein
MKLAKKQGMLQKYAADLLDSVLNDIDYEIDSALLRNDYVDSRSCRRLVCRFCPDLVIK